MSLFHPPAPPRQPDNQSALQTVRQMRRCPISALKQQTYRMKMGRINLLTRTVWLINDKPLVRQILTDQSDRFPKSALMRAVLEPLVQGSSFITNGDHWRRRRRIMDLAFGQASLRTVFPLMRQAVDDMLVRIDGEADGRAFDVNTEMAHVTADIIFRSVFSRALTREEAEGIYRAFRVFQKEMFLYGQATIIRIPQIFLFFRLRRARKAAGEIRSYLDPLIRARVDAHARGDAVPADDILATLMAVSDPETKTKLSYDELCEEIATLMLAGHETSSSTLGWSLYLSANAPDIQQRVAQETTNVVADRPIEFADIKRLTLTRNIFREALRFYPPVPFMTRETAQPEEMRGHKLRPGSMIYISSWILHRSEQNWTEPDAFDPDRFARTETEEAQRTAYYPFSTGPRVCLGAGFAMQESTLILAALLRRFHFAPVEGCNPKPVVRLSLRPEYEILLRITKR
ncbi:MAG: cytochrome P450 [Parvibaculaceae bacterium]